MEPININDSSLWKNTLQPLITIFGFITGIAIGAYEWGKWWINKRVVPFFDDRTRKLIASEKEHLENDNKQLRNQLEILEHDYKMFNEERIKELKEFIKEYK